MRTVYRYHRALPFMLVLLLSARTPICARAQDRPVVTVTMDRNGRPDPRQPTPVIRAPVDLRVLHRTTEVSDLSVVDAPTPDNLKRVGLAPELGFVLYPEDNAARFGQPRQLLTTIPPGQTTFYFIGRKNFRLRITGLTEAQMQAEVGENLTSYRDSISRRMAKPVPVDQFIASGPTMEDDLQKSGARASLARAGHDLQSGGFSLLAVPVTVPASQAAQVIRIELGQVQPPGAEIRIVAVSYAKIVKEETPIVLQTSGIRTARIDMANANGVSSGTLTDVPGGTLTLRVCRNPAPGTRLAAEVGTAVESCVPTPALDLKIGDALPSRVRYQPGIIVADRGREPRLATHMVFVRDPEGYFERRGSRSWLAGVNPSAGIQVGGSTSILVLLLGLHFRLIPEAGAQVGLRFGNENSNSGWWLAREAYFGISLDPTLFNKLRPAP